MKRCSACKKEKPFETFAKSRGEKDGYFAYCKPCHASRRKGRKARSLTLEQRARAKAMAAARYAANKAVVLDRGRRYRKRNRERVNAAARIVEAERRARKKQACPKWADRAAIKRFYAEAELMTRLTGVRHEVDHSVPLAGKNVCGLHVPANLRVVTEAVNKRKGNKLIFR